jgi:8-amino-7-oxononanoate synthase
MSFRESISNQYQQRLDSGLLRELKTVKSAQGVVVTRGGRELINFSSNDYLGLANSDELKAAALRGVLDWGVGAAASHLVCGHQSPHELLESEIATFVGAEKAIVFSSGYMANLAVPSALLSRHDLLLQDKLNHASLIDAGLLCRATAKRYRHLDVDSAKELIDQAAEPNFMLATDGVFSMNGSVADVKMLAKLCDHENRLLLVDDAHGFGVLGESGAGTLEQAGLKPAGQTLMIGTLSKAVGSFGAFVAGDSIWIDHLIQHARPYIYTTALPSAIVEATRASLCMIREPSRREKLHENVAMFRQLTVENGVELLDSQTPIQSVAFGSPTDAVRASARLEEQGFLVVAIRPPTVPEGTSRLRITLSAAHEAEHIERLVAALVN